MKFKKDQYQRARGKSVLLQINCENCGSHICYYQKDGPGVLMRMYVDRIMDRRFEGSELKCSQCHRLLGLSVVFEKEKRPAYRLFAGAVIKWRAKLAELDG